MSVLIKGMKMPTSCSECGWCGYYGHEEHMCDLTNTRVEYAEGLVKRRDDCPLIELPAEHGRLIDGDVAEVITYTDEDGTFADGILYAADWIAQQPTVIEAEEVSK